MSNNFYWMQQDNDGADKKKPGIENLSKRSAWTARTRRAGKRSIAFAADPTGEPDPQHKGAICSPADPAFDDKAAEELANATKTDSTEWGYPLGNGLEVRATPQANAPVTEKLGLHLVRVYPDEFGGECGLAGLPADRHAVRQARLHRG